MVAIKDIEMPKSCAECQFGCITYNNNRKCKISESCYTVIFTSKERPADCPLVEIITCKDCEYYREVDTPLGKRHIRDCNHATGCDDAKTFYCADAERRE